MHKLLDRFYVVVRTLIITLAVVAGVSIIVMILVTVFDVFLRIFGEGITGAYDIVRIMGVVAISCSLPYVTAIKGHIAIEFFYQRFSRMGRIILDSFFRTLSVIVFLVLAWSCILYGKMLLLSGQVMQTLPIPVFWIPWMISLSCLLMTLTIIYHLFHPGKELVKL
ncbi:MAG TPA: TRAP transporter small permease [Treponema sp.]|nr:TRAP transporter small permease [Treponema sp.]